MTEDERRLRQKEGEIRGLIERLEIADAKLLEFGQEWDAILGQYVYNGKN